MTLQIVYVRVWHYIMLYIRAFDIGMGTMRTPVTTIASAAAWISRLVTTWRVCSVYQLLHGRLERWRERFL